MQKTLVQIYALLYIYTRIHKRISGKAVVALAWVLCIFVAIGGMTVNLSTTVSVRKASISDIEKLHDIIQGYAKQGIMLPRSKEMLEEQIDTFVVAESDGLLIGCGSLTRLGPDLVEIRSLGMTPGYKGQGIGGKLVNFLVEEARSQGIIKVMALTYEVAFFQKNGFTLVPKEIFPEKVWKDCMHCKKQYCCDEIAVLKRLD